MKVFARAAVALALVALPASAQAAYPGSNGKLAFVRDNQIWTINANGTGETQLTSGTASSTEPDWSPDGARILYARRTSCGTNCSIGEVRVMNADGSGDTHVFGGPTEADVYSPTWSPDASTIAFVRVGSAGRPCICRTDNIDVANPDGSNRHQGTYVVTDPYRLPDLEWSPKGDAIAFTDDGYGYKFVNVKPFGPGDAHNPVPYDVNAIQSVPSWSPDARKLAYLNDTSPPSETEVWSINADGTGATQLTDDDVQQFGEEWSPDGTKIVYSGRPGLHQRLQRGPLPDERRRDGQGQADRHSGVRDGPDLAAGDRHARAAGLSAPARRDAAPGAARPRIQAVHRAEQQPWGSARVWILQAAGSSLTHPDTGTPDANGEHSDMVGALR